MKIRGTVFVTCSMSIIYSTDWAPISSPSVQPILLLEEYQKRGERNGSDVASDSNCLLTKMVEDEQTISIKKTNHFLSDIVAIPRWHREKHLLVFVDLTRYAIHAYNLSA